MSLRGLVAILQVFDAIRLLCSRGGFYVVADTHHKVSFLFVGKVNNLHQSNLSFF